MSNNVRFIEETFGSDKNIVRCLKDYVFVLDAHEAAALGKIGDTQRNDALATALFSGMNNPFHAFVGMIARTIILELLASGDYKDLSARFLTRIAPHVKTLLNDETPRDFFVVASEHRRKLA